MRVSISFLAAAPLIAALLALRQGAPEQVMLGRRPDFSPEQLTRHATQRIAQMILRCLRVDIDEADSWRIRPDSPAIARLRGNAAISVALKFVRFEPYVLPKHSLSGDNTERVDTRVLQVIYAFAPKDFPAFVGQQVDVFVKAPARGDAKEQPVSGRIAMDALESGLQPPRGIEHVN